jgi:outer membrane protein assembly factor BamB
MMRTAIIGVLAVMSFLVRPPLAEAKSDVYIGLGKPVVSGEKLLFSDVLANGLICISRETGAKLWEIGRVGDFFNPWTIRGREVLVFSNKRISRCSELTGELTQVYQSDSILSPIANWEGNPTQLLVEARRGKKSFLLSIDPTTFKEAWRVPNFIDLIAIRTNAICIIQGELLQAPGSVTLIDGKIAAIDQKGKLKWTDRLRAEARGELSPAIDQKGRVKWGRPPVNYTFQEGVAFESYFLVPIAVSSDVWELRSYRADTGTIANSYRFGRSNASMTEAVRGISVASYQDSVLALVCYGLPSSNVVYRVSVPEDKITPLFETMSAARIAVYQNVLICGNDAALSIPTGKEMWKIEGSKFSGIHQGLIYFSRMDENTGDASINEIDVLTGKQRRLFGKTLSERRKR